MTREASRQFTIDDIDHLAAQLKPCIQVNVSSTSHVSALPAATSLFTAWASGLCAPAACKCAPLAGRCSPPPDPCPASCVYWPVTRGCRFKLKGGRTYFVALEPLSRCAHVVKGVTVWQHH